MPGDVSTIQSLKAVDAWIDVINANINGGVRTAFKSSRLKFGGGNVDVLRAGSATALPLQFPEAGLATANSVIDFTQGAVAASTENSHLAVQGEGFFILATPDMIETNTANAEFGKLKASPSGSFYISRDGEFRTDSQGFLVNNAGLYLVVYETWFNGLRYDQNSLFGANTNIGAVYNDLDRGAATYTNRKFYNLSDYLQNTATVQVQDGSPSTLRNAAGATFNNVAALGRIQQKPMLQYSRYGATVFDFGWQTPVTFASMLTAGMIDPGKSGTATILSKSLEASNASMTQSVPELSLAQKLFSALTKVLQTKQTNVDGVLNLVR